MYGQGLMAFEAQLAGARQSRCSLVARPSGHFERFIFCQITFHVTLCLFTIDKVMSGSGGGSGALLTFQREQRGKISFCHCYSSQRHTFVRLLFHSPSAA